MAFGPKPLDRFLSPRHVALWTILGSIATVIALVVALDHSNGSSSDAHGNSTSSTLPPATTLPVSAPPPSASPTSNAPQQSNSPSVEATTSATAIQQPSSAALTYLSDLAPNGDSPDTTTIPDLAAIHHDYHSLSTPTGGCARSQDNSFAYPLAGQYMTFLTSVALQTNDDPNIPSPKALVSISVDNHIVFDRLMSVYQVVKVKVSVVGKSDLILRQQYRGADPDTCYTPATVFWADAALSS